jgi:hypothetical protein
VEAVPPGGGAGGHVWLLSSGPVVRAGR